MKLVIRTEDLLVYDDVLEEDDFKAMQRYTQDEDYAFPHTQKWMKVWRLGDNMPMGGPEYHFKKRPFNCEIDIILNKILEVISENNDMFGGDQGWDEMTLRSYLYPRGSKLSWHNDTGYVSAGIYYTHPHWGSTWGGELMIAEVPEDDGMTLQFLDHTHEDKVLMEKGMGRYVSPKPNRLVFTSHGVWHQISRVDPDAGDHVRSAIVTFLKKEKKDEKINFDSKVVHPGETKSRPKLLKRRRTK